MIQQYKELLRTFRIPLIVLLGIICSFFLPLFAKNLLLLLLIILGSFTLFHETVTKLLKKEFALDYLAILALFVSLYTQEFLVGSIIALMLATGRTLESYGVSKAKLSLTKLTERIPQDATLWQNNHPDRSIRLAEVTIGQELFIRQGAVIPLDGILVSDTASVDESSLTGEAYPAEKIKDDELKSGTVNAGDALVLHVTKELGDSTYAKIIKLVENAQKEKAPLIRLADRYSSVFTLVSLIIAGISFFLSHDITRVLSVLVIATPCPLLLATPIALLGGMNAASKKHIIVKRLSALETLSRVTTIIFDKTGTITLGKPTVTSVRLLSKNAQVNTVVGITESLERHSLHPLAKALVQYAKEKKSSVFHATDVKETIGKGIEGNVLGKHYVLKRTKAHTGMAISLFANDKEIAQFLFSDEVKEEAKRIIKHLKSENLELFIFTGDKKGAAESVTKELGESVRITAEASPKDKQEGIALLKKKGHVTAMIGDGINDAPALALADVGMVFANEEQTAASEAADIVFLGGEFTKVHDALHIARQTIAIALTSIFLGIGLSIFGMLLASAGLIPPLIGAVIQELIDVISIVNALRATRIQGLSPKA